MIRDQFHDPSFTMLFHLLEHRPEVGTFVKHAELDDVAGEALPDSAFAWPERGLFPINTAESTVLSSLYREKIAAVPAEVDELLKTAQEVYGVKDLITFVQAEIPGVRKEDQKITMNDNVLTIHGEKRQEEEKKESTYHRLERSYGSFERSFTLPSTVKQDTIEAAFTDGILTITLPKREEAKAKDIQIRIK